MLGWGGPVTGYTGWLGSPLYRDMYEWLRGAGLEVEAVKAVISWGPGEGGVVEYPRDVGLWEAERYGFVCLVASKKG